MTFSLPTDFVTNIGTGMTSTLTALGPYEEAIIGVLLTAVVLGVLISFIRGH